MKKVPSIGEAEWQVMEVLWQMPISLRSQLINYNDIWVYLIIEYCYYYISVIIDA